MTTPGRPDWTQQVAFTEVDTVLQASTALSNGGALGPYDTSQAQSLVLTIGTNAASPAGTRIVLEVEWDIGGTQPYVQGITFNRMLDYQDQRAQTVAVLPVRGKAVSFTCITSDNRSITLAVDTSTRPVSTPSIGAGPAAQPGTLLAQVGGSIAAGASETVYIPPVARAYGLGVRGVVNGTAIHYDLNGIGTLALALTTGILWAGVGQTVDWYGGEVPAVLTGCELVITNTDTVARSPGFNVWDVS